MRLRDKNVQNKKNDDNLLPLVNIIFLLLIFFMIAGVIQKQKELYKVELGTAIIEKYEEKDEKIFFIRENGIIIFEGNQITKNKLEKVIDSIKNKKNIIVAADAKITTKKLNEFLILLAKEDVSKVTLLTETND